LAELRILQGDPTMKTSSQRLAIFALAFAFASTGLAQSETDFLWPTFSVTAGGFRVTSDDDIRIEGTLDRVNSEVSLSSDLGLPESDTVLAAGFEWGFAAKHSLGLRYFALQREGSRSINRDIQIGNTVFPVGARVDGRFDSDTIEASYNYWFVRRDEFGFGGTLGLVYLSLDAQASASVTIGGGVGSVTYRETANTDLPIPMIGLTFKGSPVNRLVLRASAMALPSVTIGDVSGSAAAYSVGAEYYILGPVALGASYDGTFYDVDVEDSHWNGSVNLSHDGLQLYLRAAF
jgi:hypothetical protein